jgi:uncharacterized membrane protein YebE (DUF533 family)
MTDVNKILSQILSSGAASGAATGLAGGLLGGLLTSKAGRKMGKKALKLGGLAAVAGLAYTAYDRWRRDQAPAAIAGVPVPLDPVAGAMRSGFLPPPSQPEAQQELGLLLIRAMIAAARADGRLDGRESEAIFGAVGKLSLAPEDKALLLDELSKPVDLDALVASAATPERGVEVYAAALLAIEVDTPEERTWLAQLSQRLQLEESLVAEIHRRVQTGTPDEAVRVAS